MAVKTFEREVKKLTSEFTNLIENYNFKQYDFYSIRETLIDYIKKTYPNYDDYFRSDYIMMLIELFAFYGEMMAYRMDMNMNEVYLSTAKDRRSIIKIADMLGYKYSRIIPSSAILKFDMTDNEKGNFFLNKKRIQTSSLDVLESRFDIEFELAPSKPGSYYDYKMDFILKNLDGQQFMDTLNNIFDRLSNFDDNEGIKTRVILEDGFEQYERSIFIDKIQTKFEANFNIMVDYMGDSRTFEIQNIKFDKDRYLLEEDISAAITYDEEKLYDPVLEVGFEFVIRYDKGNNILDKNVYMYTIAVQGASFSFPLTITTPTPNFSQILYENNIFQNQTKIKQYDGDGNVVREYNEVDDLSNTELKYAYEVNNTENGHIEIIGGDGKNVEAMLPATQTLFYYRKNPYNRDEVLNVVNADLASVNLPVHYYDSNTESDRSNTFALVPTEKFNATGGQAEESNEQIKYMAKKIRSVQDRFVTAKDYETAGMLSPKVKHANVILRTYIGKNSPRLSNNFIDVFMDSKKIQIDEVSLTIGSEEKKYLVIPEAFFTESSVTGEYDYITFYENGESYYFKIFDMDELSPNDYYKYPENFVNTKSKGTIIELQSKRILEEDINNTITLDYLNLIIEPLLSSITEFNVSGVGPGTINLLLKSSILEEDNTELIDKLDAIKSFLLEKLNLKFTLLGIEITDLKFISAEDGLVLEMQFTNKEINIPDNKTFIWTHYKSDDMYLNPSKSNIIEIYVSGYKKDLKNDIETFEPLSVTELNRLTSLIEERKMLSDVIQIYNASVYEVQVAMKFYKSSKYSISDAMLKSKIDTELNKFFDIRNLPLGKHFYLSRLIEWLHTNIDEIEHIEMVFDENGNQITVSSTNEILSDKITFTQIVEKTKEVGDSRIPDRIIQIESF